jgi:hypothetical protein
MAQDASPSHTFDCCKAVVTDGMGISSVSSRSIMAVAAAEKLVDIHSFLANAKGGLPSDEGHLILLCSGVIFRRTISESFRC